MAAAAAAAARRLRPSFMPAWRGNLRRPDGRDDLCAAGGCIARLRRSVVGGATARPIGRRLGGKAVAAAGAHGWASSGGCGGCGITPYAVEPSPQLYVVNQGPDYSGPGLTVPYATYSPETAYAPAADYPYVPGYGYGRPAYPHYYAHRYYGERYAFHAPAYMHPRYYGGASHVYGGHTDMACHTVTAERIGATPTADAVGYFCPLNIPKARIVRAFVLLQRSRAPRCRAIAPRRSRH